MRLGGKIALCVGAALLAVGLPMALMNAPEPRTRTLAKVGGVGASASSKTDTIGLFPDVKRADVVTLAVATPERSFDFERVDGEVSVNGHEADEYAFSLLVKKVVALPVSVRAAFEPTGVPDLVLTLHTADGEYTASFYGDGQDGERSLILCGTAEEPIFRETDGWRVATLLMACDGTRIFDEAGFETPAD